MGQQLIEPQQGVLGSLVGREEELARLSDLVEETAPISIAFLHGIAGIGKSTLLSALAAAAQDRPALIVAMDCRTIEPTEPGFLHALAAAVNADEPTLQATIDRLHHLAPVVVLTLDNYEVFRLMDTWLRQVFARAMPRNVRVILAGRQPPVAAWLASHELEGRVRSLPLGPLDDEAAISLFHRYEVPKQSAARLNRIVRGHPLAIKLAASTLAERPELALEDVAAHRAVDELTNIYLSDIDDPMTRRVLEAAACVRRVTRSLLQIMLPDVEPDDAFDRVHRLPFVETRSDGLIVHEAVREAVASSLRATDPHRYRQYRRAAWRQLKKEVKEAGTQELWRYTADMLYMIENPVVREAFFPSEAQPLATEPARPGDLAAIETISARHDGPEAGALLRAWWERAPESFSVIRDRDGVVTGFFYLLNTATMLPPRVPGDPVAAAWWRHLREHPVPKGQVVLGLRRWLDLERGELPCATQAACWLDVKRTYMELRPHLRRIYVVVRDVGTYWPIVEKLGFQPIASEPELIGTEPYASVMLDFGPGSVDGWLAGLVGAELGVGRDPVLDEDARELVFDGQKVALTPLEFGVLKCLDEQAGKAVSRAALLQEVWGYDFSGETNVVNMVVASLRQKLGPYGELIHTIRSVGYRLPEDWQDLLV